MTAANAGGTRASGAAAVCRLASSNSASIIPGHGATRIPGPDDRGKDTYALKRRDDASLRLEAGDLPHLAPFRGFRGDEPPEVGRRAAKRYRPEIGKPRLER